MKSSIRKKPLIELLRIGIDRGVIDAWHVDGPHVVLKKDRTKFSVPVVDAASLLQKILVDQHEDQNRDRIERV